MILSGLVLFSVAFAEIVESVLISSEEGSTLFERRLPLSPLLLLPLLLLLLQADLLLKLTRFTDGADLKRKAGLYFPFPNASS